MSVKTVGCTACGIIAAAAVYLLASAGTESNSVQSQDAAMIEAESYACGRRAVFIVGRTFGLDLSYDDLARCLPVRRDGASLLELERVLTANGVDAVVCLTSPSDLSLLPMPFIAYWRSTSRNGIGHYVVVNRVTKDGLEITEPMSCEEQSLAWKTVSDRCTGHCLVVTTPSSGLGDWALAIAMFLQVTLLAAMPLYRLARGSKPRASDAPAEKKGRPRIAVSASVLAVLGTLCSPAARADAPQIRVPERDGVNAAVILASLSGRDFKEILNQSATIDEGAVRSFLDVQHLCEVFGCRAEVVRLNYDDLATLAQPVLVLLRDGDGAAGQFAMILDAGPKSALVLRTGPVEVQEVRKDQLLHAWTGHGLVAAEAFSTWPLAGGLGILIGALASMLVWWRWGGRHC